MVALVLEVILDRVTFLDLQGEGWGFPLVLLGCHGRFFLLFPPLWLVAMMIVKLGAPDCHFILGVVSLYPCNISRVDRYSARMKGEVP